MNEIFQLEGKVALVTGGSRGLGSQMVLDFAAHGANVVIASRNKAKCEEVAHEVEKIGRKAVVVDCDVASMDDIEKMFSITMKEYKRLDILVNNAGVNRTKPAVEVTSEDWDYIFDVNIKGLFFCSQKAAQIMIQQNYGKIINLASVGGVKTYKRIAPYTASKAAVIHLTRSLASEWARHNIYVNAIAPGLISTDINQEEVANEALLDKMLKSIPLRRLGEPKDISNIALYLASGASNYVTGQTFYIDGGTLSE
jgi:NAD(P)-dependent dehydrogenase (short-subunit alcohol dehydrogenase family)